MILCRAIATVLLFAALTSAVAAASATVYFIHPEGIMPSLVSTQITINGRAAGRLRSGTYIVRSVPAGPARFGVTGGLLDVGFETQMTLAPGRAYYIGINLPRTGPIGQQAVNTLFFGGTGGAQMKTKPSLLPPNRTLNLMDPGQGRAAMVRLRRTN